jgi:hypothetical protein
VTGLYRYVRNPMYLAVATLILGQAALFGDWRWRGDWRFKIWPPTVEPGARCGALLDGHSMRSRFARCGSVARASPHKVAIVWQSPLMSGLPPNVLQD